MYYACMTTASTAPIMLRAEITPDEWTELRKLALDARRPTQALVADALRATYDLDGDTK